MCRMAWNKYLLLVAVVWMMVASFDETMMTEAVVGMDGVPDSKYVVNPKDFPGIVPINNYWSNCPSGVNQCRYKYGKLKGKKDAWNVSCAGTVISPKHIISARHCFCRDHQGDFGYTAGFPVWVAGKKYMVKGTYVPRNCGWSCRNSAHPNQCDIAIMELETPIKLGGKLYAYPIYDTKKHGTELGKKFEFYGWGVPGKAGSITAQQCDSGMLDQKFRRGENRFLGFGRKGTSWGRHSRHILKYMMRGGTNPELCKKYPKKKILGLPVCNPGRGEKLEAVASSGDSGTPAFIRVKSKKYPKGRMYLAGVNSSASKDGTNDVNGCTYGSVDEFTRLSKHIKFIQDVITGRVYSPVNDGIHMKYSPVLMPMRKPGDHLFPYKHELGHRRRRGRTGTSKCHDSVAKYFEQHTQSFDLKMCHAVGSSYTRYWNRKLLPKKPMLEEMVKDTHAQPALAAATQPTVDEFVEEEPLVVRYKKLSVMTKKRKRMEKKKEKLPTWEKLGAYYTANPHMLWQHVQDATMELVDTTAKYNHLKGHHKTLRTSLKRHRRSRRAVPEGLLHMKAPEDDNSKESDFAAVWAHMRQAAVRQSLKHSEP